MRELFKFHDQSSAPAESKQLLEKVKASSGMIPGLYAVLAESPEALKAYVELGKIDGILGKKTLDALVSWYKDKKIRFNKKTSNKLEYLIALKNIKENFR